MCPLLLSALRPNLVQTPAGPAQASSVVVSSIVHLLYCVQKLLFPWYPPFPLTLNILSESSSTEYPWPWEGGI